MSEEFVASISRAGFELTLRGSGNQEAAGETLRKAFPGCAVSFMTTSDPEFDDPDAPGGINGH